MTFPKQFRTRTRWSSILARGALASLTLGMLGGCATSSDDGASGDQAISGNDTSLFGDEQSMFGNDRVGRAFKANLDKIPNDFPGLMAFFKTGTQCKRGDGKKEIYIVEERQRGASANTILLPRAVITGCNTGDISKPETQRNSYSLMQALISDDSSAAGKAGDTMLKTGIETMALDDTTGLFNFYVFDPGPAGKPGTISRFFRAKDGTVMTRQLVGGTGKPTDVKKNPGSSNDPKGNRCFNCHVDGAPIMNELSEPWTNWVSPKKTISTDHMSGMTKDLVSNASLADQFEQIIRAATSEYVSGDSKTKGWFGRTRDGLLPGGIAKMVRPLFCEEELNYLSADSTKGIPMQVYFDPSLTAQSDVVAPNAPAGDVPSPFLLPIRAVYDESAQQALVDAGYVDFDVAVAIRLLDDENDVFSTQRCGVLDDVTKALKPLGDKPTPAAVAKAIKDTVGKKADTLKLQPAQLAYLKARLAGGDHDTQLDAYNAELLKRFDAMDKSPKTKESKRKSLAHKMFPGDASNSPLPELDPP